MKKLPAIPRWNGSTTFSVEPWEFISQIPEELKKNKAARFKWSNAHDTRHCFYSGFEGVNAKIRINKDDNPVSRMLALVVDYDRGKMNFEDAIEQVLAYDGNQFVPNYACETLSGGMRLVWIMEKEIVLNPKMAKALLKFMKKEFNLDKLLPGLDVPALEDPGKYYEVGVQWKQLSAEPLPEDNCFTWLMKSSKKLRVCTTQEADVPLERAQSALEAKYPDIEFPKFEIGMRMKSFWDNSAKNDSAACLLQGGFYSHSTGDGFMGWERLLGRQFMKEFEIEQTGIVVKEFWYDGRNYISRNPRVDGWLIQSTQDAVLNIAARFELSKSPPKRGELSPIERVMHEIQLIKRVKAYANFVHFPEGPIEFQREQYVNVSRIKAMAPSKQSGGWGEHFPFLAQYFEGMIPDEFERLVLLAWWKRYYAGALSQKPEQGQVLIIAGPPSCGKTLFNTKILAPSVGGGIDTSDYYTNGGDFGGSYYEFGLHMVDDSEPGRRIDSQKAMAARYKKTAASKTLSVNQKYEKVKQIAWLGRVCTTMNSDPESLKTMPELQRTLEDKIIVLKAEMPGDLLEKTSNVEARIAAELPHLLQWLLDWEIPVEVRGEKRWGVVSHCNRSLRLDMESGNTDQMFLELLASFIEEVKADNGEDPLETSTTDLISRMRDCERIRQLMNEYKPVHVGHILARFSDRGYGFELKRKARGNVWVIQHDFWPKGETNE